MNSAEIKSYIDRESALAQALLNKQDNKMSKSSGNVIAPQTIIDEYGCDPLRLWVVSCDYTKDMRIGPSILKQQEDTYRRYRNTLRYLLGALNGFSEEEKVPYEQMPELERWVLHKLAVVQEHFQKAIDDYEIPSFYENLHFFCAKTLSAFYFDIRKDSLYCDDPESLIRRSVRTVMDIVFQAVVLWLGTVLCFTAEEAWQSRYNGQKGSIKLQVLPVFILNSPKTWKNDELDEKFNDIHRTREILAKAIEQLRKDKVIGSSSQVEILFHDPNSLLSKDIKFWEDIFIVSKVTINPSPEILKEFSQDPDRSVRGKLKDSIEWCAQMAPGKKCQRCWKIKEEVGNLKPHDDLCQRCNKFLVQSSLQ